MPRPIEPFCGRLRSRKNKVIPRPSHAHVQEPSLLAQSRQSCFCLRFGRIHPLVQSRIFELVSVRIDPKTQPPIAQNIVQIHGITPLSIKRFDGNSEHRIPQILLQIAHDHHGIFQALWTVIRQHIDGIRTFTAAHFVRLIFRQISQPQQEATQRSCRVQAVARFFIF